ncbi:uncharacterized protein LOC132309614 [Cornus florida]|uniref:uncharacterized protein LOC132309614 n=1 Tax=Cornus florida TaxID=4283 RepID=UPI0028A01DE0|nr:uncharacterized protein LOC132309614 [Cornus florida]
MFIGGKGKIGYITDSEKEPAESEKAYPQWFADNTMVMSWLVNSMQLNIAVSYMFMKTAKQIWDSVQRTYSQRQNNARIFQLGQDITRISQGDLTVSGYIAKLRVIWEEMSYYNSFHSWKYSYDAVLYAGIVENNRVFQFLAGLNDEFNSDSQPFRNYTIPVNSKHYHQSSSRTTTWTV